MVRYDTAGRVWTGPVRCAREWHGVVKRGSYGEMRMGVGWRGWVLCGSVERGSLGGVESGAVGLGFLRFVWHGLFWQLWKRMELKVS